MNDWSMLKKLIWLHIVKGGSAVLKTVTGSLIHITDALALPAEALTVNIEPIQAGSGDPSPDNVRPISGRTSATVTRTGKNLINIDAPEGIPNPTAGSNTTSPRVLEFGKFYKGLRSDNYYYPQYATYSISNGVLTVSNGSNNAYGVAYSLKVSPGDSITISAIASNPLVGVGFYDSDWNFIAQSTVYSDLPRAYVVPANAYCAVVVFRAPANGTATYENIQIELGSTASAYEPYQGNTYTIQLGDTVYGGTLDVTAGKMVVDRAMVDLGTLNWQYDSVANFKNFWAYGFTVIAPPPNNGEKANILCSNYKTITANEGYLGTELVGIAVAINQRLFVYDPNYSDASVFKTAMSGVQLCYELATPIEISLTPTQIEMLLGENNLWADAGDLTLTYYADGNASTSEALGILLGGTYNNPGGADDVSDDEALGILLGGS